MTLPLALYFSPASLTGFDWLLVAIVVVSMLMAFHRGFVRVLFSLLGLVLGILLATWNYVRLAGWLERWIRETAMAQIVAYVAIVMAVLIVATTAAAFVRKGVRVIGLGFVDRVLGAGVGFLRGLLLGVAAMMAMAAFLPGSTWIRQSVLAPYFLDGAHAVSFVVPQHFQDQVSDGARHLLLKKSPELLKQNVRSQ